VGCGKGRVLLAATRSPVGKLVGIEMDSELAGMARQNLARQPGNKVRVEIRNQNALDVDYDEATSVVLVDPFGAETLKAMLARLRQSIARRPRPVRLVFVMAISPQSLEVLSGCGWLECREKFEILTFAAQTYQVSLWTSVAGQPA
jgi:cyclopropane fatty-acyl-phospholipid synthase-like methyltransferase